MAIKVIIAVSSPLNSQLLSHALGRSKKQFTVVGCEHTVKGFTKKASAHHADVAVVSAGLEGDPEGGLKALRDLRAAGSTLCPIVLLDSHNPEAVLVAFSAGAKGVLSHTDPFEVVCKCIRCVHDGQVWANSQQLQWILQALADRKPSRVVNALGIPLLTPRQEQIVRMVVEGLPNSEISTTLRVSAHTVRNHLYRIYEKLGVSSRVELILYALSRQDLPSAPTSKTAAAAGLPPPKP
jgi:DNA-binding NarL/FixJ family response regulator